MGLPAREAIKRYLPGSVSEGQSARGILGRIRRQLVEVARSLHREDLAMLFEHPAAERIERAEAVMHAIGVLRSLQAPAPQVSDDIGPSTQRSQRVVVRMAAGGNVAESN